MRNVILIFTLTFSIVSQAYDMDTHFYGTYAMARFTGIRHEVSLKIATAAQWVDESYISDPLTMIIFANTGVKKRRLLHFPGSRVANKVTVNTLPTFLDPSTGEKLRSFTETEADHEFGTELFNEGLMRGDLMMAAAGLHTLEDSFAHAGTIVEIGHSHFWHHPDRPYIDEPSIEKYLRMSQSVIKALVAMRSLLPMSALDTDLQVGDKPNYQMNGEALGKLYVSLPQVRAAISRKILNDPGYVRFAIDYVFKKAFSVKYLRDGYQKFIDQFEPGQDSYEAAATIAAKMPMELINLKDIMKDQGRPDMSRDYIVSMGGEATLISKVIRDLVTDIVPRPLTVYHRFEKEEDGPVWIKEMDLRIANMRALIYDLYGKNIQFIASSTGDERGYLLEMSRHQSAQPQIPKSTDGREFVTYSLQEKYKFNQMIFEFMFPQLSHYLNGDFKQIAEMAQLIVKIRLLPPEQRTMLQQLNNVYNTTLSSVKGLTTLLKNFTTKYRLASSDIMVGRVVPHVMNRYFTSPGLLRRNISQGIYKPLMSPEQVDSLVLSHQQSLK
ncbi:MAG: hypothetical protein A2622_10820 [Bdellovibrionales bacterium RIFCSPHIGHO2_01_FULL_40_29]|nr:MAG: hypothetical protein A2622_10820 [Bdellovibrionales bacterium RIFCSPHIGHO2_01_FULL_40_29]